MSAHTPTPWDVVEPYPSSWERRKWSVWSSGNAVATVNIGDTDEADARFIVRACNSHDELLALCKELLEDHQRIEPHHNDLCRLCRRAADVLRQAEAP